MKSRIFGRKLGTTAPMVRLVESDDPTPYAFTPDADFVYPAVRH